MKTKKIIFGGVGLLISISTIVLIELLLSLFNVASVEPLFITDKNNPNYFIVNPKLGERLLDNSSIKPALSFIKKTKEKSEYRIIILGASTVVGFPYGHEAAFPKILEQKLKCKYPNSDISVINLGLTAINTYSILEIMNESLNIKPDLVLIYTGQNEFYGRYGVGSSQNGKMPPWLTRIYLWLKRFRLTRVLYKILKPSRTSGIKRNQTLMSKMVGNKQIFFKSTTFNNAIKQFNINLGEIVGFYRSKDIPVIIGNLVTNQKGLPPFKSYQLSDNVKVQLKIADSLKLQNQYKNAVKVLNQVYNSKDSTHAMINFKLGQLHLKLGNNSIAKKYFMLANRYDLIRFRAPQEFNDIIKSMIDSANKVYYADIKSIFEKKSIGQIIGNELLLEHVHPRIKGYRLMAKSYLDVIESNNLIKESNICSNITSSYILKTDSIFGTLLIERLKNNWPFKNNKSSNAINFSPTTIEGQLALDRYHGKITWAEASNKLYKTYLASHQTKLAFKVAYVLSNEYPILEKPILMMSQALLLQGKYPEADSILEKYSSINFMNVQREYFRILLLQEKIDQAIVALNKYYFNPDKEKILSRLNRIAELTKAFKSTKPKYQDSIAIKLAEEYKLFGIERIYKKYIQYAKKEK